MHLPRVLCQEKNTDRHKTKCNHELRIIYNYKNLFMFNNSSFDGIFRA